MVLYICRAKDCMYECSHKKPHKKNSNCLKYCEIGDMDENTICVKFTKKIKEELVIENV